MSKLLMIAVAGFFSINAYATLNYDPNGPTKADAEAVQAKIEHQIIFDANGVNGDGITACDVQTGVQFYKLDSATVAQKLFVNCVDVSTATDASLAAFRAIFPENGKVDGVFVDSANNGVISAN